MKIFKRVSAAFLAFVMLFLLASCADKPDGGEESTTSYIRENKTKLAVFSGVTSLGVAKLVKDRDYAYESSLHTDINEIETLIKNGSADIAAVPVESAARLFNETKGGVKIIAVNGLGCLQLLTKDDSIKTLADIKDKTVYASGKDTAAEHILNFIFEKNSINPQIEYVATEAELAALAIEGKADICIISEPQATKVVFENAEMKRVVDFNDEWNKVSDAKLAQSVIVARTEYIEQNPEYIEQFLFQNEISVNFLGVSENADLSADMLHKGNYFSSVDLARACVPECNLYFVRGEEMKAMVAGVCEVLPAEMTGGTVNADGICFVQ